VTTPYTLADAEERVRRWPWSFLIPEREERVTLRRGMLVKLVFHADAPLTAERMWVEVQDRRAGGTFAGVLCGDAASGHPALRRGTRVEFEARHVADIDAGSI
jgi:hypothetical protein